jgi:hypothetical protein
MATASPKPARLPIPTAVTLTPRGDIQRRTFPPGHLRENWKSLSRRLSHKFVHKLIIGLSDLNRPVKLLRQLRVRRAFAVWQNRFVAVRSSARWTAFARQVLSVDLRQRIQAAKRENREQLLRDWRTISRRLLRTGVRNELKMARMCIGTSTRLALQGYENLSFRVERADAPKSARQNILSFDFALDWFAPAVDIGFIDSQRWGAEDPETVLENVVEWVCSEITFEPFHVELAWKWDGRGPVIASQTDAGGPEVLATAIDCVAALTYSAFYVPSGLFPKPSGVAALLPSWCDETTGGDIEAPELEFSVEFGTAQAEVSETVEDNEWLFDFVGASVRNLAGVTIIGGDDELPEEAIPVPEINFDDLPIGAAGQPLCRYLGKVPRPDLVGFLDANHPITKIIPKTRVTAHLFECVPLACRPIQFFALVRRPRPPQKKKGRHRERAASPRRRTPRVRNGSPTSELPVASQTPGPRRVDGQKQADSVQPTSRKQPTTPGPRRRAHGV